MVTEDLMYDSDANINTSRITSESIDLTEDSKLQPFPVSQPSSIAYSCYFYSTSHIADNSGTSALQHNEMTPYVPYPPLRPSSISMLLLLMPYQSSHLIPMIVGTLSPGYPWPYPRCRDIPSHNPPPYVPTDNSKNYEYEMHERTPVQNNFMRMTHICNQLIKTG